ncbi:hypothetical protein JB92DRAFT_3249589 [Gautieria morchelliformis]|nr:hypothetical protein JB92DRAFT_3249589 [Gautieria morchelliformis]
MHVDEAPKTNKPPRSRSLLRCCVGPVASTLYPWCSPLLLNMQFLSDYHRPRRHLLQLARLRPLILSCPPRQQQSLEAHAIAIQPLPVASDARACVPNGNKHTAFSDDDDNVPDHDDNDIARLSNEKYPGKRKNAELSLWVLTICTLNIVLVFPIAPPTHLLVLLIYSKHKLSRIFGTLSTRDSGSETEREEQHPCRGTPSGPSPCAYPWVTTQRTTPASEVCSLLACYTQLLRHQILRCGCRRLDGRSVGESSTSTQCTQDHERTISLGVLVARGDASPQSAGAGGTFSVTPTSPHGQQPARPSTLRDSSRCVQRWSSVDEVALNGNGNSPSRDDPDGRRQSRHAGSAESLLGGREGRSVVGEGLRAAGLARRGWEDVFAEGVPQSRTQLSGGLGRRL